MLPVAWVDALKAARVLPPRLAGAMVVALLIGCPVLPCIVLWLRQPHGARVSWDENAMVEWDGDRVRTRVPWTSARAATSSWRHKAHTWRALQIVDRDT